MQTIQMFVYLLKLPKMCGECARASVCVCASLSATSKCVYLSNLKLLLRLLSRSNLSLLLLFASTLNAQHVHRNFGYYFLCIEFRVYIYTSRWRRICIFKMTSQRAFVIMRCD